MSYRIPSASPGFLTITAVNSPEGPQDPDGCDDTLELAETPEEEREALAVIRGPQNFDRSERKNWTPAMVQVILDAFRTKVMFPRGTGGHKSTFYVNLPEAASEAVLKLAQIGHVVSEGAVKSKWASMCYQYRLYRNRTVASRWPYFQAMHEIITNHSDGENGTENEAENRAENITKSGVENSTKRGMENSSKNGAVDGCQDGGSDTDSPHDKCPVEEEEGGVKTMDPGQEKCSLQKSTEPIERIRWTRPMCLTLLDVMKKYLPFGEDLERAAKRTRAFKEAAEALRLLGHGDITASICSGKWSYLVKTYGLARERKESGDPFFKADWDFYEEMHEAATMNENKPLGTRRLGSRVRKQGAGQSAEVKLQDGKRKSSPAGGAADLPTSEPVQSSGATAAGVTAVLPGGTIVLNGAQYRVIAPATAKRRRSQENDLRTDYSSPLTSVSSGHTPGIPHPSSISNLCVLGSTIVSGTTSSTTPHPQLGVVAGASQPPLWFQQWLAEQAKQREIEAQEKQRAWEEEKLKRLEAMHKEKVQLLRELIQTVRRSVNDGGVRMDKEDLDRFRENLIKVVDM